jgi:tetratricopeptide (TPR) repeat protein
VTEETAPEVSASQEENVMARPLQDFALALSVAAALPSALLAAEEERGPSVFEGRPYQLQLLDEPAPLLVPVNPRTVEIEQRSTAAAWFMTGRLHQQRERFDQALKAYEKAAELEPGSIEVIRAMIDMALRLNQGDKALKYAIDAVKLDPDDFQLLRQLGVEMVRGRKLDQAIKYLEQARNSPKLKELSGFYVLINRDLGIIYKGLGEIEKAADSYEVVLSALLDPKKYGLDRRTRDELQKNRSTSYEQIGQVFLQAKRNDRADSFGESQCSAKRQAWWSELSARSALLPEGRLQQRTEADRHFLWLKAGQRPRALQAAAADSRQNGPGRFIGHSYREAGEE